MCETEEKMFYAKLDSVLDQCPCRDALVVLDDLMVSINQSGGHTTGGALPRLPYGTTPGSHALLASMQAPFPYPVTPSRRHRLAAAKSSVGVPLASSKLGCPLWKQPDKQDRLPVITPHAHIAEVDADQ